MQWCNERDRKPDTYRDNNSYGLLSSDEPETFATLILYVNFMNDLTRSNIITRQEPINNQSPLTSCTPHIK